MDAQFARVTEHLAELLFHVPAIMMPGGLDTILAMVKARGCDLPVPVGGNMRIVCYQLINAAAARPGALQYLAHAVRRVDVGPLGDSFADEVARQLPSDFFTVADRLKFVAEIAKVIQPDETYMYYERIARAACRIPLPDAETLVRELEELIADDMPCHPLVLLTEEIAVQAGKRAHRKKASELSDQLAVQIDSWARRERGGERSRLAALRVEKRETSRTPHDVERATLTLRLEPHVPRQDAGYRLQIWLYRSDPQPEQRRTVDGPLTLAEIRREVIEQIDEVVLELSRPKAVARLDLEFILPRSMLGYPVEDWGVTGKDHITLGTQFQVVMRDGDRLHHPVLWTPWQEKWRQVPGVKLDPDEVSARWLTCLDAPRGAGELYRELLSQEYVWFGLTFPPEPEAGRLELHDALDAGVPVAVWPRGGCAHPVPAEPADPCAGADFKRKLCREMAGQPLRNMPELVMRARRSGAGSRSGLALLWDDADRRPPSMLFDAPRYRRPDE